MGDSNMRSTLLDQLPGAREVQVVTARRLSQLQVDSPADLPAANAIISSAVRSWCLPDRLERLSLPLLQYKVSDLEDLEISLYLHGDVAVGVSASEHAAYVGSCETRCVLLHGLYVRAEAQKTGVGEAMQQMVAMRAGEQGYNGLLVKSHRVSTTYFESLGYTRCTDIQCDYPYLFWKALPDVGSWDHDGGRWS